MNIGKITMFGGIILLLVGGIITSFINKDYKLGVASILIGCANFILLILR